METRNNHQPNLDLIQNKVAKPELSDPFSVQLLKQNLPVFKVTKFSSGIHGATEESSS